MVQITRNKADHSINPDGLARIDAMTFPTGTKKYYVVVSPEGIKPKITVPKEYFGKKGKAYLPKKILEVFYYHVPTSAMFCAPRFPDL